MTIINFLSEHRHAVVAAITSLVLVLLARSGRRPSKPIEDWHRLTPGAVLYALAIFFLFLAAFFAVTGITTALAMLQGAPNGKSWFLLLASPIMLGLFLYAAGYLLACRIQFNEIGIARRFLGNIRFVPWTQVMAIERHWFFGPMVVHRTGRLTVWEYLRGFKDLCDAARKRGIPVDL
jgi:hypothetical protein